MPDWFIALVKYGLFHPVQLLVLLTAVALLLRVRIKDSWAWTVAGLGLFAFALRTAVEWPCATDLRYFWVAGCDIVAGIDPYRHNFILTPPTGFPVFALFGLLSLPQAIVVWTALNIVACTAVVVLARLALAAAGESEEWQVTAPATGVLSAALVMSVSCRYGLDVGQLAVLTTLLIFAALWARYRERPVLAGVALALGTIKVGTLLPFLLLFRKRKDIPAWAMLAAGCVALYAATSPLAEMPQRLGECLHNIAEMGQPNRMNDYTKLVCADLINFDRAIYYCGVADRAAVRLGHYAAVLLVGAWVAWLMWRRSSMSEAARCCLVAFYAALFLYHRLYDMPILALPLVYAFGRAQHTKGLGRWLYVGSAAAVLGVLYLRLEAVKALSAQPYAQDALGRLLQAAVIPYGVWLTLLGLLCLAAAERVSRRQAMDVAELEPEPEVCAVRLSCFRRAGDVSAPVETNEANQETSVPHTPGMESWIGKDAS